MWTLYISNSRLHYKRYNERALTSWARVFTVSPVNACVGYKRRFQAQQGSKDRVYIVWKYRVRIVLMWSRIALNVDYVYVVYTIVTGAE